MHYFLRPSFYRHALLKQFNVAWFVDRSTRAAYSTLETPGDNKLRAALDTAVRAAYGLKEKEDILAFLLTLNLELAEKETKGKSITPPGLPVFGPEATSFITVDCVKVGG